MVGGLVEADPRIGLRQIGWYVYDCANSAFSTSVLAVFIGPYITSIAADRENVHGIIAFAGIRIAASALFSYLLTCSVLLRLLTVLFLGAMADFASLNKRSLCFFAYIGASATAALAVVKPDRIGVISLLFVIAAFCWGTSLVFYNALLPAVCAPEDLDRVSCRGSATGYFGGALLLGLHLIYIWHRTSSGADLGDSLRLCLLSSGVWWAAFTTVSLFLLGGNPSSAARVNPTELLGRSLQGLRERCAALRVRPGTVRFLIAFSLYNCGMQTVMALAGQFAFAELGMKMEDLAGAILMLQFAAMPFPFLFHGLAARWGSRNVLLLCLSGWIAVLLWTWRYTHSPQQFLISLLGIAVVIASTQALSRSIYSRLIPLGEEARMFSVYEFCGAATSWCGPLLFGLTLQLTHSYRSALLSIVIFFIAGALLLFVEERAWAVPATSQT